MLTFGVTRLLDFGFQVSVLWFWVLNSVLIGFGLFVRCFDFVVISLRGWFGIDCFVVVICGCLWGFAFRCSVVSFPCLLVGF